MAIHHLGYPVDIHSGGADLTFPHHESEIAQAEGATGESPFVRFWVHTAMVHHQGEKMSKSLGNLVMVSDLLESWSPDAIRLYLASHHYREPWEHDQDALEQAEQLARTLREAVTVEDGPGEALDPSAAREAFVAAMDDDLDTPRAVAELAQWAEATLSAARAGRDVQAAQEALRSLGRVFGLRFEAETPEEHVIQTWDRYLQDVVG
jgi:cysteinyl-tRNA synthetase